MWELALPLLASTGSPIRENPMKKTITICIVACVALLAPAGANASKSSYSGSVEPAGTISFKLKSKNGEQERRQALLEGSPGRLRRHPEDE